MQVLIESAWLNKSDCCKPATLQIGSFPLMVQAAAANVCCLRATSSYQMDRSRVRVFAGCRGGIPNILRITLDYTQIMLDCPSAKRIEAVEPSLPSSGKRGKIDSTKIEFGASVALLRCSSFCGSVGPNISCTQFVRSIGVAPLAYLKFYHHSSVRCEGYGCWRPAE